MKDNLTCLDCGSTSFTLAIIPNWLDDIPVWVYSPGFECDECGFVAMTIDQLDLFKLNTFKAEIEYYTKQLLKSENPDTRLQLEESKRKFWTLEQASKKSEK